ncbi:MAG TPA: hypothetical protein VGX71_11575 [Pseudaminobacter sp.]|nr:hypothetical protein [Pseudaminobacter sp.]
MARPAYVSPVGYRGLSCGQIANEVQAVSARAAEAAGIQNQKATGDAVAMTVGLAVFWPALFLMKGDGAQAAEVARLKGEMQALETASRRNGCNIQFQAAPAPKPVKTKTNTSW